jgi:DNA-binding response OmpR family regulator
MARSGAQPFFWETPAIVDKKQILIVEDDAQIALLLLRTLDDFVGDEIEGSICPLADMAMSRLQAKHFDLLITDICMPGMNGLDLVRHVFRTSPQTQVLVITAFDSPELEAIVRGLGVAYLPKPFRVQTLAATIKNLLGGQAPEQDGSLP